MLATVAELGRSTLKRAINRLPRQVRSFLQLDNRVWIVSFSVTGVLLAVRLSGILQIPELAAFDQAVQLRRSEPMDDRILIVGIDEKNLRRVGQWPLPDAVMASLIRKLKTYEPRAIGLDIYRDLPVEPGHRELLQEFRDTPNLIGIEKISDRSSQEVRPPAELRAGDRVGFNNVVLDSDGRVRRSVLYLTVDNKPYESFALKLSLRYLQAIDITPKASARGYLQLGHVEFPMLQSSDGGYVRIDNGGYQLILNPRGPMTEFRKVSLDDVLQDQVPADWFRGRIVLIGSTATSTQDFFYTSLSSGWGQSLTYIPGVELHAQFISQILSAVLDERPLIKSLPEPLEWGWIFGWSWLGAILIWRGRASSVAILWVLGAGIGLTGIYYGALLIGWWFPFVPAIAGLIASAVGITGYLAYQEEELRRSKEFLSRIINAIPDPIFVKDRKHRWMVVNEAYCQFVGRSLTELMGESDLDTRPMKEPKRVWQREEEVFRSGMAHEDEEECSDESGVMRFIATKRSLHRDAAGNLFLVGVIRDITERKRMEEDLKRTAAELARSNVELRITAFQDPLTGLPNRKLFHDRLIQALEWASFNNQFVALLFLDLDGFKAINDTQGHDFGDLVLKSVAQRLSRCLRGTDTVARLGGDEFTVILPAIPSREDAARVADKIRQTLSQPFTANDITVGVTTSIGISFYPIHGETIDVLIKQADKAMYQAKQLGKNQYMFADDQPLVLPA